MNKIRFILNSKVKKAYEVEDFIGGENFTETLDQPKLIETMDRLPEETFKIIGKLVSFIEISDKLGEEENENK